MMIKPLRALVVVSLMSLAVWAQKSPGKIETAVLKGRVTDTAGAVIQKVRVVAVGADGTKLKTHTDDNGNYELAVKKGTYTVNYLDAPGFARASKAGYVTSADFKADYRIDVVLEPSDEGGMVSEFICRPAAPGKSDDLNCEYVSRIVRSGTAIIKGRVFDLEGAVVAKAEVRIISKDGRIYRTQTNDIGHYKIELPEGQYKAEFDADHFGTTGFENLEVTSNSMGLRNIDAALAAHVNINTITVPVKPGQLK